jgi:hypothetical protein
LISTTRSPMSTDLISFDMTTVCVTHVRGAECSPPSLSANRVLHSDLSQLPLPSSNQERICSRNDSQLY